MPDTPETEGRRSGRARHSGPSEWWNSPATGRQALPFNKFLVGLQFPTARTRGEDLLLQAQRAEKAYHNACKQT